MARRIDNGSSGSPAHRGPAGGTAMRRLLAYRLTGHRLATVYKMNTQTTLRRLFPAPAFRHATYTFSGPPTCHANRLWLARLWQLYEWLMPPPTRKMLHIFIQKT